MPPRRREGDAKVRRVWTKAAVIGAVIGVPAAVLLSAQTREVESIIGRELVSEVKTASFVPNSGSFGPNTDRSRRMADRSSTNEDGRSGKRRTANVEVQSNRHPMTEYKPQQLDKKWQQAWASARASNPSGAGSAADTATSRGTRLSSRRSLLPPRTKLRWM